MPATGYASEVLQLRDFLEDLRDSAFEHPNDVGYRTARDEGCHVRIQDDLQRRFMGWSAPPHAVIWRAPELDR